MKQKRKESGWGCKILTNLKSFWISSLQNISILKCEGMRETFNAQLERWLEINIFFLFFTQMMQFGLKVNLMNFPKAVRPSKRVWSVLSSEWRICENSDRNLGKIAENCWKFLSLCHFTPLLDPPQTYISKVNNLWHFSPQWPSERGFQEGNTSIQRGGTHIHSEIPYCIFIRQQNI